MEMVPLENHFRMFGDTQEMLKKKRGGGFKYFLFSSLLLEDFHFDYYFSTGLVQPPTRKPLGKLSQMDRASRLGS